MNPIGAKLFASSDINLILKIKLQIEAKPINPKQPRAIKDEGTWTYIILTESPWIWSGGDINKEYIRPIITTIINKRIRLFITVLLSERILFGKKFFNILIDIT